MFSYFPQFNIEYHCIGLKHAFFRNNNDNNKLVQNIQEYIMYGKHNMNHIIYNRYKYQ